MGDKVSSRRAAQRGGAPIVPGTTEFAKSADEIRAFGARARLAARASRPRSAAAAAA